MTNEMIKMRETERVALGVDVQEVSCHSTGVETLLDRHHVILSGGAVSNRITREHFNHYRTVRYAIEYDMPDFRNIRIRDRVSALDICADYSTNDLGSVSPRRDWGILTVMNNPQCPGRKLIGAMGIHGFGSKGVYRAISDPPSLRELMNHVGVPDQSRGFQVLVRYDVPLDESSFDWHTLHNLQ